MKTLASGSVLLVLFSIFVAERAISSPSVPSLSKASALRLTRSSTMARSSRSIRPLRFNRRLPSEATLMSPWELTPQSARSRVGTPAWLISRAPRSSLVCRTTTITYTIAKK
jgi:hypothetical protein